MYVSYVILIEIEETWIARLLGLLLDNVLSPKIEVSSDSILSQRLVRNALRLIESACDKGRDRIVQ